MPIIWYKAWKFHLSKRWWSCRSGLCSLVLLSHYFCILSDNSTFILQNVEVEPFLTIQHWLIVDFTLINRNSSYLMQVIVLNVATVIKSVSPSGASDHLSTCHFSSMLWASTLCYRHKWDEDVRRATISIRNVSCFCSIFCLVLFLSAPYLLEDTHAPPPQTHKPVLSYSPDK